MNSIVNGISVKDIIYPLSKTMDLIDRRLIDHHKRVTYIAEKIARVLGLGEERIKNLIKASSIHDIGAVSEKIIDGLVDFDADDRYEHSEIGYNLIRDFKPFSETADIIKFHHAHFDMVKGRTEVPLESLILHLADRIDILVDKSRGVLDQVDSILSAVEKKSGTVFSPVVFEAFRETSSNEFFWLNMGSIRIRDIVTEHFSEKSEFIDEKDLFDLANIFSKIIDFRSRFTATHSSGVAAVASEIAGICGFDDRSVREINIAGLFHDIGKVAVPEALINKEGPLTRQEFNIVKSHVYYTYWIFDEIEELDRIKMWASCHHERLNGTGYPFKFRTDMLDEGARIMAVADIFTALMEDRPYRKGLTKKEALDNIRSMSFEGSLCGKIVSILESDFSRIDLARIESQERKMSEYREYSIRTSVR